MPQVSMRAIYKKIFIGIVIATVVVAVSGYFTFKVVFSPKHLKNSFQQVIAGVLNRNVDIGEIELKLGNLVLKNIKVDFKKENELGKTFENFIECEKIQIKFNILPLFKRKFVFKEVKIKSLELILGRQPAANIAGLLLNKIKKPRIESGISSKINRFSIEKGSINLFPPAFSRLQTKDIDLQIKSTKPGKPIGVNLNFKLGGAKSSEINLSGNIDFIRAIAEIKKFQIYSNGSKINIVGEINKFLTDPQMDLNYNFSEWPHELMPANMVILGEPVLKGKIKSKDGKLFVNWNLDLSSCKINYGELYQKDEKSNLKFQGGIECKDAFINLNWYVVDLHGTTISGTGSISNGSLNIDVRGESMDLRKLVRGFKFISKHIAGGELTVNGKIGGSIKSGKFSGKIGVIGLKIKKIKSLFDLYNKMTGTKKNLLNMGKVDIEVLADNKKLRINSLTAENGDIEGRGKGYYIWNKEINFTAYPRIRGKEIGFQIHGSTDNVKIDLK